MKRLLCALAVCAPIFAHGATVQGCEDIARTVRDAARDRDHAVPLWEELTRFSTMERLRGVPRPIIDLELDIVRATYRNPFDDDGLERGVLLACLNEPR